MLLSFSIFSSFVYAEEHFSEEGSGFEGEGSGFVDEDSEDGVLEEIYEEYAGDDYEIEGGIAPDSPIAFLDFDFGPSHEIAAEKAAEIAGMIERGADEEDIRKAFEKYEEHMGEFLANADPAQREEVRKNTAAIHRQFEDLGENGEEYFEDIEGDLEESATAVEISGKILELCNSLAELDPSEYARVCITDEDDADWHKKLDRDLTAGQEQEARKFAEIMSQCFRTSGQDCACEEIPFPAFANACSEAAPLAVACEIDDDEDACEALDDLEMPELPDHLQDVFDELEEVAEDRFELHMPRECQEAGVDTPEECGKLMITTHAPEECREALLAADVQNEREGREICEGIMFRENRPEGCEGVEDPRDCAERFREEFDRRGPNRGPGFGGDCRSIENSEDRLKCYDGVLEGHGDFDDRSFEDRFREVKAEERQCAEKCSSQGKAWDFSNGCSCFDEGREDYGGFYKDDYRDYDNGFDCAAASCQEGYDCVQGVGCVLPGDYPYPNKYPPLDDDYDPSLGYQDDDGNYYQDVEYQRGDSPDDYDSDGYLYCNEGYESDGSGGCIPFGTRDYGFDDSDSDVYSSPPVDDGSSYDESYDSSGDGSYDSGSSDSYDDSSGSDSGSTDSGSSDSGSGGDSGGSDAPITGGAITGNVIGGNRFLNYYFNW